MTTLGTLLQREVFDAARLMVEYPPRIWGRNKRVVQEIGCPADSTHSGVLEFTRWRASELPGTATPHAVPTNVVIQRNYYDYAAVGGAGCLEWHVNFADPRLFVAYGSELFAQDEMMVAEHPALGALLEALLALGIPALTVEHGGPTPCLVSGVERRCRVATDRNRAEGRPDGLYGVAFGRAAVDAVRKATTRIDPPTRSNLIAIAAPALGRGRYTEEEIRYVLVTAFTGFRAAVLETERTLGGGASTVLHTGFWGCGAFGGNRGLMVAMQILAARWSGVNTLVFHALDELGSEEIARAQSLVEHDLVSGRTRTEDVIQRVASLGFEWGVGDGN